MLRAGTVLLLAVFLSAAVPIPSNTASGEGRGHYDGQAANRADDSKPNSKTLEPALGVDRQSSEEGQHSGHKPQEPGRFGIPFEGLVAGGTWALFIATAGLFFFTLQLWRATKTLIEDERKNTSREQRAYVFGMGFVPIASTQTSSTGTSVDGYVIRVPWKNTGKTPARNLKTIISAQSIPNTEKREPWFDHPMDGAGMDIGPGLGSESSIGVPIDELIALWKGTLEIYVWARVEYSDIFFPNVRRHCEACARLTLIHDPRGVPPPNHQPYIRPEAYGAQNSSS